MSINLGIFGAGRFANAIAAEVRSMGGPVDDIIGEGQFVISWMLHKGEAIPQKPVDVVIDASVGSAVEGHLEWALETRTPFVIGATGWNIPNIEERIGTRIGVLISPNFSFAVALMQRFAIEMARFADWYGEGDVSIFEHHHAAKKDAPSGTAKSIASSIIGASKRYRGWSLAGWDSDILPVTSLRSGSEVGVHELTFDAPHERFSIVHQARDRELFASGALKGAQWILRQRGAYYMSDMLDELLGETQERKHIHETRDMRFGCSDRNAV
jgi:4-hydroxy-tetrahydrodipicolinate reductase